MKVFVIRHGLTELNKKQVLNGQIDEPLSKEGMIQAENAISTIPKSVKYIYTSPLLRARHTAEIINSKLNLPLYNHLKITEIHMGSVAGKSWSDFKNGEEMKQKHRSINFNYKPAGGESSKEVKKRILEFIKEIKDKHSSEEVLIVAHGGIIRTMNLLINGKIIEENIENASITEFDFSKIFIRNT